MNEVDINFHIKIGYKRNGSFGSELYFCWRGGLRKIAQFNLEMLSEKIKNGDFENTRVSLNFILEHFNESLKVSPYTIGIATSYTQVIDKLKMIF